MSIAKDNYTLSVLAINCYVDVVFERSFDAFIDCASPFSVWRQDTLMV